MSSSEEIFQVLRFCIGMPKKFGPKGIRSGIDKRQSREPLFLGELGFTGDGQGDLRHHGGSDKAVHHYCADHIKSWKAELPAASSAFDQDAPFGENIVGIGKDESNVCIGDIFNLGSAVLQISQARQPCWKLNHRFGVKDMARRVQETGRTGWYYRVLQQGVVSPNDHLIHVDRLRPEWTLKRVINLLYVKPLEIGELKELGEVPELSESWKALVKRREKTKQIEDWKFRLERHHVEETPVLSR